MAQSLEKTVREILKLLESPVSAAGNSHQDIPGAIHRQKPHKNKLQMLLACAAAISLGAVGYYGHNYTSFQLAYQQLDKKLEATSDLLDTTLKPVEEGIEANKRIAKANYNSIEKYFEHAMLDKQISKDEFEIIIKMKNYLEIEKNTRPLIGIDSTGLMEKLNYSLEVYKSQRIIPSKEAVLLSEAWVSGKINKSIWATFGSPEPEVYGAGDQSLNVNGDNWCNSGAYSRQLFDAEGGLTLDFRIKPVLAGPEWMSICVGLTGEPIKGTQCDAEGQYSNFLSFRIVSIPRKKFMQINLYDNNEHIRLPYPGEEWKKYRLDLKKDGIVELFINDSEKPIARSSTRIELSAHKKTRVQFYGQAYHAPMLIDDIILRRPK